MSEFFKILVILTNGRAHSGILDKNIFVRVEGVSIRGDDDSNLMTLYPWHRIDEVKTLRVVVQ